jgi:hypothetical protein
MNRAPRRTPTQAEFAAAFRPESLVQQLGDGEVRVVDTLGRRATRRTGGRRSGLVHAVTEREDFDPVLVFVVRALTR